MVDFRVRNRLVAIQIILVAIHVFPIEVNGWPFSNIKNLSGSVIKTVARVPSMLMDGGQKATHVVGRGLDAVTSPIKPLQSLVHAGGGVVSNVLGSSSRLLGKSVLPPRSVIFLYSRQLNNVDDTETVKLVLGLALYNVILHSEDMDSEEPIDLQKLSVLHGVAVRLQKANAHKRDIYDVVKVLGRNGQADLPKDLEAPVVKSLIDKQGNFRRHGTIEEIRFIADHPKGWYMLDDRERTEYKLNTNKEYLSCTRIYPPLFEK